MNDSDMNFDKNKKSTYRATSNLNTAIENPQINMNSVVGVNIKNVNSSNSINDVNSSNLRTEKLNQSFQEVQMFESNINSGSDLLQEQSFNTTISDSGEEQKVESNFGNDLLGSDYGVSQSSFGSEQNINQSSSQFIPIGSNVDSSTIISSESDSQSGYGTAFSDEQVLYEPTMQEKKKHNVTFKVTREFKVMLFIVFILFIFILLVPYIYDFFKDLQLVISAG